MKALIPILIFSATTAFAQPNVQWSQNFGGSGDDNISGVVQATDGNYVMAGTSNSSDGDLSSNSGTWDVWLAKFNNSGTVLWEYSYGGSLADQAIDLISTADGGYAIVGYTNSTDGDVSNTQGLRDVWVLKFDAVGTLQWEETFGGSWNDYGYAIDQTSDGGYIVAGTTQSDDGDVVGQYGQYDVWVIKLSASGSLQWQNTIGGTDYEEARSVEQTSDGGYIVCGRSGSSDGDISVNLGDWDTWVAKLDASGAIVWEKSFGGTSTDYGFQVRQTTDGGYIVAGSTYSEDVDVVGAHDGVELWNVKLDASGNMEWQHPMGGWSSDWGSDILETADGGFLTVGSSRSDDGDLTENRGGLDVWLIKTDAAGSILWQFTTGGTSADEGYYLAPTMDGGYIIGANTLSDDVDVNGNYGSRDIWIVKVEPEPVGIDELSSNEMTVGPVPAKEQVLLTLSQPVQNAPLELVDNSGRTVWRSTMQGTQKMIPLQILVSGVYHLSVQLLNGVMTRRIVVE